MKKQSNIWLAINIITSGIVYILVLKVIMRSFNDPRLVYHLKTLFAYFITIAVIAFIRKLIIKVNIKINSIPISSSSNNKFSAFKTILLEVSDNLEIKRIPELFISATASRYPVFHSGDRSKNEIYIFKSFFVSNSNNNMDYFKFIIARELLWIKDNNKIKNLLLLPAVIFPPFYLAYLRELQNNLDKKSAAMFPNGAKKAISMIGLYPEIEIEIEHLISSYNNKNIFVRIFGDILSPVSSYLKRLSKL